MKSGNMAHGKFSGNESSAFGFPSSSSFPQYKTVMPNDQVAKLLAMHRESTANAGIYVAVVLAVYVVLLSLLLCRYVRRRPRELPGIMTPSQETNSALYNCPCPLANCLRKPVGFLSAIRHCSLRGGTGGVSSLSSNSKDEHAVNDEEDNSHPMNPLQSTKSPGHSQSIPLELKINQDSIARV